MIHIQRLKIDFFQKEMFDKKRENMEVEFAQCTQMSTRKLKLVTNEKASQENGTMGRGERKKEKGHINNIITRSS